MSLPIFEEFLYPFLLATSKKDMTISEMREYIVDYFHLSEEYRSLRTKSGNTTQVTDRLNWVRPVSTTFQTRVHDLIGKSMTCPFDLNEIVPLKEIIPEFTHKGRLYYLKKGAIEFAGTLDSNMQSLQKNIMSKTKSAADDDF